MMLPKFESGYPDDNDSSSGQLLRDIEEISKALYLDQKTDQISLISSSNLRPKSKPKPVFDDDDDDDGWMREEQKPSSIWGWKPFKALSHFRQRKFTCCFFCHVHCIENLPSDFSDVSMSVHWKRKDGVLMTQPSRVSNGMVEFEETMVSKCVVYYIKNGSGNFVKYEPKHFLLYASVTEAGGLDIGKHWVDLARLLPLTIEELEEDKCSGKWSTSFKLAGKAKGAILHVSFAFLVTKDGLDELGNHMKVPLLLNLDKSGLNRRSFVADVGLDKGKAMLRRVGSVPSSLTNASSNSSRCSDVKFGWPKDVPDYSNSISVLCKKLEQGIPDSPAKFDIILEHLESLNLAPNSFSGSAKDFNRAEYGDDAEFTVIDKGIELEEFPEEEIKFDISSAEESNVSTVEVIDVAEIFKGEGISSDEETKSNEKDELESPELDLSLDEISNDNNNNIPSGVPPRWGLGKVGCTQPLSLSCKDEISDEIKENRKESKMVKSLSLDDVAKAVADDLFNLLQGEHTPSSLSSSGNLESPRERLLREFEEDMMISGSFFSGVNIQEDEIDTDNSAAPSVSSLDYYIEGMGVLPVIDTSERKSVKQSSKSRMKAQLLESLETQSLMQRWGLNEEAFQSSTHYSTGGFGSPIFVPPEEPVGLPPLAEGLGSLLQLKNGGLLRSMSPLLFQNAENCGSLVLQASKPVVLPAELGSDITEILQCMASVGIEQLCKQVHQLMPLEELSGRIMQQLAWEASCKEEVLERPASSQHESDVKIEVEESSHFPGCSYSNSSPTVSDMSLGYVSVEDLAPLALDNIEALLIEGLKIQSGMSDHDAPSSIKVKSLSDVTSRNRILYSDQSSDFLGVRGTLDFSISLDEWVRQNESGKFGVLGDNLTVAIMMQLRDPHRNYEPVGAPMLCLIQLERVFKPVSEPETVGNGQDRISRFAVNEVHVAGLNTESSVPEFWASRRQQMSGSRWLLASGLTKNHNSHFSKSRSITTLFTRVLRNDTGTRNLLWSISRPTDSIVADLLELSMRDPLIRNPDIIFPEEAV